MKLLLGDAKEKLKDIEDNSIGMICTDPPYGKTRNGWDIMFPLDIMWSEFKRVIKPKGNIVITSTEPFTSLLVVSNLEWFGYDIIWSKTIGSGQLSINSRPLKCHENILVFYEQIGTYNEQLTSGEPYKITRRNSKYGCTNYKEQIDHIAINEGTRRARSVIDIINRRYKGGHTTQKPVELMIYLLQTYSNEDDVVLDPFAGSFSTAIAAHQLKRDYIMIEKDKEIFDRGYKNLEKYTNQLDLFKEDK